MSRTTMFDPLATEKARTLERTIRQRMGDNWWKSHSDAPGSVDVIECKDGIMVWVDGLAFFHDPQTGDLICRRWRADSKAEYGTVENDGTIRWGWCPIRKAVTTT